MKFPSFPRVDRQRHTRLLVALAAMLLALWSQWLPPSVESYLANEWLRDRIVLARASHAPETRMVVVDIDEGSLAAAGPWPWPRDRIADLIEQLLGYYGAAGGDQRLAMLAQHGPLVLPNAFDFNGSRPLRVGTPGAGLPMAAPGEAVAASGYIANHAGLARAAHVGNIGFVPDADGMIRRLPLQTWFDGQRYPTLSLALLDCCGPPAAA